MGRQHEPQGCLSETLHYLLHQGLIHLACGGEVTKFRVDLEDRMENEFV